MRWAIERDLLIAETMAFVQSVTGKAPAIEARVEPAPIDEIEKAPRPAELIPLPSAVAQSDVRREIQCRVAAFRAHQQLFLRERDAYCNSVLAKARATADSPPTPGNRS